MLIYQLCSDTYGVDVNSDYNINQFPNWTQADLVLVIVVTVDLFDPNKAGTMLRRGTESYVYEVC